MGVSLRVGPIAYPVGTGAFLGAFFDTVSARLEDGRRGSRFPLLGELYLEGELGAARLSAAASELALVREGLAALPPSAVVWDLDDPSAAPPWGDDIAPTITDLSTYFVTSDGRPLLDVMATALDAGTRVDRAVQIR
ncbi:Imm70 family immunity protein [Microbacterium sp.]|uniref:Imm70 family immunity protein n=1 Tax=Microbacterium sp. TaxID=51671 RepID=UPI0039E6C2B4